QRMAEYLVLYNSKRPHKSLELMTPVDYILRESKNCNMWWTHTIGRSIRRSAISCARSLKMRTSGSTFTPAIFSGCWRLLAPSTRAIWIFTV
ncbi:hypothetical protein N9720_13810, partial [Klebsiella pneumoniae]|nr:hypothetical protein [Klebsiella pneumoniae]